jgi:hypothetical protein
VGWRRLSAGRACGVAWRQLVRLGSLLFGRFLLGWTNLALGGRFLVRLGVEHRLNGAGVLGGPCLWAFAADCLALVAALVFLLPAFPFFLVISVSLPMMIPLDGVWPKAEHSDPRHAWSSMRDLGKGR